MAEINEKYKEPVENGLEDGTPCLLGTVSADDRPEIGPKGSVIVYMELLQDPSSRFPDHARVVNDQARFHGAHLTPR